MNRRFVPQSPGTAVPGLRPAGFALLAAALAAGCEAAAPPPADPPPLEPTVRVVHPTARDLVRRVAQPGVIAPYEETAVYTRVAGYVLKWNVDIGDRVTKDQVLAELIVPELAASVDQKRAAVDLAKAGADQARKQEAVAKRNVQVAADEAEQAKAEVARYTADVERWQGEVARLTKLSAEKVVDPEVLAETQKQFKASVASKDASTRGVSAAVSRKLAADALVDKAAADVAAADAQVKVAAADLERLKALLAYTQVTAPYDGVVSARNVNTGDAVRPASGDPTGGRTAEGQSADRAIPLFVLHRTDRMLFVVGVPERDAGYVVKGTPASVQVPALGDEAFPAAVSRTAWSLDRRSRTLQAQIDLPNPAGKFVPGMYANGTVRIERAGAKCVPAAAVFDAGDQTCVYLVSDGKAVRTPVQTGLSDGDWVEVRRMQVPSVGGGRHWQDVTGTEAVAVGDLSEVTDGGPVKVATAGATD